MTNQVAGVKRAGTQTSAQLHSQVNVGRGSDAVSVDADCLVNHRDQDTVYNEACALVNSDRGLAERLHQLIGGLKCLVVGQHRTGNLNQLHDVSRVEEVYADNLCCTCRNSACNFCDGQRRSVGTNDAVLVKNGIQILQQVFLQIHSLQNNFHDELGTSCVLTVDGQGQVCQCSIHFFLCHLAALYSTCEVALNTLLTAFAELFLDIDHRNRMTGLQEYFCNTGTHVTCAKYRNLHYFNLLYLSINSLKNYLFLNTFGSRLFSTKCFIAYF